MSSALERVLVAGARRLERPAESLLARPRLRFWLHRRARRAWRTARQPLILCYGNINRSAFAVALAGRRRPGARSGGFYPVANRSSPQTTVACAARYGVDLSPHRSRRIGQEDLSSADALFVFDLQNAAQLAALDPRALARTHFVGALGAGPGVLIADPHGRGEAFLEDTLARIARALEDAEDAR